jgi:hypothetical protein
MFDDFELALNSYLVCALWSSLDHETGEALDEDYTVEDFEKVGLAMMEEDLWDFIDRNAADLEGLTAEEVGHNFWLTRNRHGAGFWDLGLGERGDRLTEAAHTYGKVDLVTDGFWVYAN